MDYINEYFKSYIDKINFIEIKDSNKLDIKEIEYAKGLPLPIMSDELAKGISTGDMAKEISLEVIIDGMVCTLAIDHDFKHSGEYIQLLKLALKENLADYVFFEGIKYLDQQLIERADLYFRALTIIKPDHLLGRFNYALALERLGQKKYKEGKTRLGDEFIKASTLEFELSLDIDEDYPLTYYKLGYHYKFNSQYLKAKLMWEKYLKLDDNELRKQEIREEINIIEDNVEFESGLTYLSYNRFAEALDSFLKILPRQQTWWELRYLIGNCYGALGDSIKAIEEYEEALKLNDLSEDVYNELAIELFKIGRVEEAIKIFTRGIDKRGKVYKFYFNRGLGYLQLGDVKKAYEDIKIASDLEPSDKNVNLTKKEIEEKYLNI